MTNTGNDSGLLTAPYHVHEHPFEPYEQALRHSNQSPIKVPKHEVPKLPARFEEHYPANGMQEEGAQASYRDDKKEDSVHAIEFQEYWKIHIDAANPRFPEKQLDHLATDAPITTAIFLLITFVVIFSY